MPKSRFKIYKGVLEGLAPLKNIPLPFTNPQGKGVRGMGRHCLCEERSDEAIPRDRLIYIRLLRLWLAMTPTESPVKQKTTDTKQKERLKTPLLNF